MIFRVHFGVIMYRLTGSVRQSGIVYAHVIQFMLNHNTLNKLQSFYKVQKTNSSYLQQFLRILKNNYLLIQGLDYLHPTLSD